MQVTVEATGRLERTMKVRVPADEIEKEISQRLKRVARTAKIKGFRPGKIPPKVVQSRYGTQVRQEVLSDVLQQSYQRAIQQQELVPAGGPRIQPDEVRAGEDFSYTAVFEIFPKVKFHRLEGLALERPQVEITDDDVADVVERLRRQQSSWEPVERSAEEDDRVTVDFSGTIDGEPFDGGEGEDVPIVLGEGTMLDDFEHALYGVSAGDLKTVEITFPETYRNEALRGKDARIAVKVKSVEQRVLPDLDDGLAERFGVTEGGVEALRAQVRENLEREVSERLSAHMKRQVLERLVEENPVETPEALIRDEIRVMRDESMRRLGIEDPKDLPGEEAFRESAQRRVAVGLLINELIKREGIRLDQARVAAHIQSIASAYDQPDEVIRYYQSQPHLRSQAEMAVLEQQVAEWLTERAEVTEKPTGFKEFMGE